MNTYLLLFATGLAQFGTHFSDEWIDRTFGNGWAQLFSHMIGVLVAAPFFEMLMAEFDVPTKRRRLIMLLFFVVFFFSGLGTLAGWVARPSPNHMGKQ